MPVNALSAGETYTEQQTLDDLNTENSNSTNESNATSAEVATDSNASEEESISEISSNDIDSSEEKLNNNISLQSDNTEDEEEPSTDNWELGLVFYDSTVDNGKTPLTSIDWDASDGGYGEGTPRVITVQINYKNTNAVTTYEPGELEISVPNLFYNTFNSVQWKASVLIGANDATHTGYDWDFFGVRGSDNYTSPTIVSDWQKTFLFKNANVIEEKSNFEGSIQMVYTITPDGDNKRYEYGRDYYYPEKYEDECTHNYSTSLSAKVGNDIASNEISLNYTRTYIHPWERRTYKITEMANKISSYDGLGDNASEYIWVQYITTDNVYNISDLSGYPGIRANAQTAEIRANIPEECVVYDNNGNKLTANNGSYIYQHKGYGETNTKIFVGYPKSIYNEENNNLVVSNPVDLYGIYEDSTEYEYLSSATVSVNLAEYEFEYDPGELYGITKSAGWNSPEYSQFMKNPSATKYNIFSWYGSLTATYTGTPMTVRYGDDLMFITDKNSEYRRLEDEEYYHSVIYLRNFTNKNNQTIPWDKYDAKLYLRYAGSEEYVLYDDIANLNLDTFSSSIKFEKKDKVVGYYVEMKDVKESITNSKMPFAQIVVNTKDDIAPTGSLYNFNYLQVYHKDENGNLILQNEPSLDSYVTDATKLDIATYDKETYGVYLQRAGYPDPYSVYKVKYFYPSTSVSKSVSTITQNESTESFTGSYTLRHSIGSGISSFDNIKEEYADFFDDINFDAKAISKFEMYDLLPQGMELMSTKEEILNSFSTYLYTHTYKTGKETFKDSEEFLQFLKQHAKLDIMKNWKDTNRTYISLIVDFSEEPVLFLSGMYLELKYNWKVSYDSFLEFGNVYDNYVYAQSFLKNGNKTSFKASIKDNGYYDLQASDINMDGNTEEYISYAKGTATIKSVISSHQDVQTQVQTTKSNFTTDKATSYYDEEYTYKLRVRLGQNAATNMIIASNIEMGYGNKSHWQGKFMGIDTSYIENKTWRVYEPKNVNADEDGYVSKKIVVKPYYSINPEETDLYLSEQTIVEENGKEVSKTIFKTDNNGNILKNTNWKEYNDSVDKSTVKSLAFELLDKETGEPAVIPANSLLYVLVKMQAPEDPYAGDDTIKDLPRPLEKDIKSYAYNNCWTQWNPIDEVLNTKVDFVTGINSNTVRVRLFDYYDLTVNKTWDDENNKWGLRPYSIDIILKKSDIEIERKQITKDSPSVVFRNLLIDDSKLYSIEEEPSLFYEPNIIYNEIDDSYEVTNTLKDDIFKDISGTKTWVGDKESNRPESITIKLLKDGAVYRTTTTNSEKEWKYSFEKVPVYNADETECVYSVEEVPVDRYSVQYTTPSNGLAVKFNSKFNTESVSYDYVEIYYKQDGQTFKLGRWGGTTLAGQTVIVPTKDFYLYWRTDGSGNNYYGFSIDSIEAADVDTTGTAATLPNYTATELKGNNYPETVHNPYPNSQNLLWHYTGEPDNEFNIINTYEGTDAVNLSFVKAIEGTDEAFEKLQLDKDALYKFQISMKNKETGNIISLPIDNKNTVTVNEVPVGTYIITEKDDMYFDFVSIETLNSVEGVTFEKVGNDYVLTITENASEEEMLQIKVNNKIEPDRPYEDKKERANLFDWTSGEDSKEASLLSRIANFFKN